MKQILHCTILVALMTTGILDSSRVTAQGSAQIDVTGKWIFQVETQAGSGMPIVTFKQSSEKLTGHYSSATFGEVDFTGTVKGRDITFKFTSTVQGMTVDVTYTGTIESNDAMKGKLDIAGLADGTFTGKRQ